MFVIMMSVESLYDQDCLRLYANSKRKPPHLHSLIIVILGHASIKRNHVINSAKHFQSFTVSKYHVSLNKLLQQGSFLIQSVEIRYII